MLKLLFPMLHTCMYFSIAGAIAGIAKSATGVAGGLFKQAAEKKRLAREAAGKKEALGRKIQREGTQSMSKGQQRAFQDLINSFGKTLGA